MLELIKVHKKYKNHDAVNGLCLTVEKGEILGLLGINGAGKSTTIAMIATLIKPDRGDILFNGENIVKNPAMIRKDLGFVPQEVALYTDLSGEDNLKFWGRSYHLHGNILKERIKEVQNIIGLEDSILKNKVRTYSGGMKRRLNIGAALLHQPGLVVMDEPTAGIDIISRKKILEAIKWLNHRGTTILYTGHYMDELEDVCTRYCVIDEGYIKAEVSKEELIKRKASLEQFFLNSINKG